VTKATTRLVTADDRIVANHKLGKSVLGEKSDRRPTADACRPSGLSLAPIPADVHLARSTSLEAERGRPELSANQGSHEPTPTAFLSVERRATTTAAASHFWISRRTPPIRNPML
jgi:hypothetical protein